MTSNGLTNCLKTLQSHNFNTVEKAIDSKMPSLVKINKVLGTKEAVKVIATMIVNTTEFLNVPKLTGIQIKMTAEFIYEEYYFLNISDLNLCFKNGMKGKYGELYNRIDGQIILKWLREYEDERVEFAENRSYQKHDALTAHEKDRKYDGLIDRLKEAGEKINKLKSKPISSNQKYNKKTKKWKVKK